MTFDEALKMAETWTKDLKSEKLDTFPIWEMVKALMDHTKQQEKDIKQLTNAVRAGMTRNKELLDELRQLKR